jgi:O-antigen ligase
MWVLETPMITGFNLLAYYLTLPTFSILLPAIVPKDFRYLGNEIARWLAIGALTYFMVINLALVVAPESVSLTDEFGVVRLLGLGGTHPAYTTSIVPFMVTLGLYFLSSALTPSNMLVGLGLLIIAIISVIATASRAALASASIAVILLIVYAKRRRLQVAFLILTILVFLSVFIIPRIEESRIEYFVTLMTLSRSWTENRLFEYLAARDLFLNHPLFGTGLGGFRRLALPLMLYYADRIKPGYSLAVLKSMQDAPFSINSTYLFYLVQTGIIGFCLFAYLVVHATHKLAAMRQADSTTVWDFLCVGWVAFLFHLFFVQGFIHPLLWFIIALSLSLDFAP